MDEDEDVTQLVRLIGVLILDDTRSARLLIRTLLVRLLGASRRRGKRPL